MDVAERLPPPPLPLSPPGGGPQPLLAPPRSAPLLGHLAAWDAALAGKSPRTSCSRRWPTAASSCAGRAVGLLTELTDANKEDLLRRACFGQAGRRPASRRGRRSLKQGLRDARLRVGAEVLAAVCAAKGPRRFGPKRGTLPQPGARGGRKRVTPRGLPRRSVGEAAPQALMTPLPRAAAQGCSGRGWAEIPREVPVRKPATSETAAGATVRRTGQGSG